MRRMKQAVCLLLCFVMVVGLLPMTAFAAETVSVSGSGNLVGGTVYTLDTNGVTANKNYLIVSTNSDTGYALTNSNNSPGRTEVTISNGTITVEDDSSIAWTFSGTTSGTVGNNGRYVYPGNSSLSLQTSGTNLTISSQGNGAYQIYRRGSRNTYYLRYSSNNWNASTSSSNVYLYEYTSASAGEAVTFTVAPGSATIAPEGTQKLTGTVTVAGETVDLSDCTIAWASSNSAYATVSDGTVTGVADGSANVTATLSAVNGTALQENIVLTIPVTVASKQLDEDFEPVLTGNDPITINQGETPDFSGIQLEVKYEGDEETTIITVANGLMIGEYDNTTIGSSYLPITFGVVEYGTVRLTVKGNPYAGKDEATSYPEYPADGAVRIDKNAYEEDFQNTGVVRVELDVAGVSVRNAVDAVLTIDISNSMAWATGTTSSDGYADYNKLDEVMAAVKTFASILLANNDDGTPTNNTVTIVTFAGYDAEHWNGSGTYVDSVRTLVTATSSIDVVDAIAEGTHFNSADNLTIAYVPANADQNDVENVTSVTGSNRGDTNYDYAFWQTEQAIVDGNLGGDNREIHVLFMTDGCASNYNNYYYRSSNVGYYYRPGTTTAYTYYAAGSGTAWTDYIKTTLIANNNGNIYANDVYDLVDGMYAVGFDMAHGSFSGISSWSSSTDWEDVFNDIVSKSVTDEDGNGLIPVTAASDSATLKEFYESLGRALRYAGTQANVTDVVDSEFNLQLTQTTGPASNQGDLGFKPTIEIRAYDLWTKEETSDTTLIGTRETNADGSYKFETLETITFSDDGTQAFSDKVDGGATNILSTVDGETVISAHYFTYTCTAASVETFEWNIGNITDKEVSLIYYAYLTGTLEGTRPEGLYYTNEEAILEYLDINDDHATQIFPMPQVAWGGASTAYEFYLVNEKGEPCDRNGNVVPFANRIIITGPFYEELYLNQSENYYSKEIVAAKVLPAGYTLYDETSSYTVQTASGDIKGSLTISEPADGLAQTTIVVYATTPSYIQSRVAFGVMYNQIPEGGDYELAPDQIVLDYGKSIEVDVAANNTAVPSGYSAKLVGFSMYYDNTDLKIQYTTVASLPVYDATYGDFSISSDSGVVKYTPTHFVDTVENIFCIFKITNDSNANDTYYLVDVLRVIPATSVYYETDFAILADGTDNAFDKKTTGAAWNQVTDGSAESTTDTVQNDGTIGQNTYGFDTTYEDDTLLSDGDSWFVQGQGYDTANGDAAKTYVLFNIEGTGFDLISRTGAAQGLIKVEVFSDGAMTKPEKTVSVLNKSESDLELYQIPVVSINDLAYGTHYVRVSVDAAYTYEGNIPALSALNRGDEFFFDAIRVFDPAKGNTIAEAAYTADGESNRQLSEVRALLLDTNTYATITGTTTGMFFIDRTQDDVTVADYAAIGPNNETYLSKGQAVAFKVSAESIPASFDIGAKSIQGNTAGLKVTVTNGTKSWTVEKSITSGTAQNIDLLAAAAADASILTGDNTVVVVTNTADGVLSITDVKVAYGNAAAAASEDEVVSPFSVAYTVDTNTFAMARNVLNGVDLPEEEVPEVTEPETTVPTEPETEATEPETTEPTEPETEATEPEVTEPELEIIRVSANTKGGIFNRKTHFTVTTSQDVATLKIAQMNKAAAYSSMTYQDLDNGTRVWTVVMPKIAIGTYIFTAYGADGTRGDSASVMSWGL